MGQILVGAVLLELGCSGRLLSQFGRSHAMPSHGRSKNHWWCQGPGRPSALKFAALLTPWEVKYKFIKTTFIKKSNVIKIYFHQKPISSTNNFIRKQLQRELGCGTKHDWGGKNNIVRISVKVSSAEETRLMPAFRVSRSKSGVLGFQGLRVLGF